MAYELKDYLKAINESKEDLMKSDETWIKKYPAYIINRCLSMFWDTLPQANEMNGYHFLDNKIQFQFLINSVRKKKRFGGRWLKQSKLKNLEYVKEYFGYSTIKAKQALEILTEEQLDYIRFKLRKGGLKK